MSVRLFDRETGAGAPRLPQAIGPGPASDQLEPHGEGPDHICSTVEDIPVSLPVMVLGTEGLIFIGAGRRDGAAAGAWS